MTFKDMIHGLIGLLFLLAAIIFGWAGYEAHGWSGAVFAVFAVLFLGGILETVVDVLDRLFGL